MDTEKKFVDLCKNIEVRKEATLQDFLDAGFTNADKRYLYFCRKINGPKGYNASFSITIRVKTKEIDDIDLLFEDFLQPKSCQKIDYEQSEEYIKMLVNKRVLLYGSKGEDRRKAFVKSLLDMDNEDLAATVIGCDWCPLKDSKICDGNSDCDKLLIGYFGGFF